MGVSLKDYRYSYVNLFVTIILFSTSFLSYENAIPVTLVFLLIVNLTCFSNEYLVMKYYKMNQVKKSKKGYALFITIQIVFTLLLIVVFRILPKPKKHNKRTVLDQITETVLFTFNRSPIK